jgi:hypothetical protein
LDMTNIQLHLVEVNADEGWKDMVTATINSLNPYFNDSYQFTDSITLIHLKDFFPLTAINNFQFSKIDLSLWNAQVAQ